MQKKSEAFPKKIYLKPALEERLAQILAVPLTVAAAPFGYGKTTAVKKVLLSLSVDMLWDTCYTGAEAAFWRCFVKSLQTAGVDTASLTWQELPRNAATRQRVIEVLQASKLKKTVVFVWNNYHLLGSEDCDKLLLALAKADLPNWHFVLLAQRPPDFTLDELVLKGECLYLQPKDFAFEVSDIIVYYRKNGIVLERRAAENLLAATEGWVSALYLYLRQYHNGQSPQTGEELLRLVQAVAYNSCSEAEKTLLTELSILNEDFSGRQAAYITENDAAPALLENLALRHGFISYELLRGQYHIHNAFKVYLQRLGAELPDTERRRLCRRSGQWYELQNYFLTAFCYYHTAGDYDKMLTVFEKDRGCSFENNYKNKIMAYFGEAPETIRQKHIKAGLIYALWLFLSGENERLQQEIRKLRKYIGQLEDRQEREQCLGELEFLLGETQYNDVEAMAAYFKKSLQLVRFFSPQTIWGGGANSILFMFYRQAGTLQKTLDVFPQAMAYYYRLVQNHGAGSEYVLASEAYFQRGYWEKAFILATEALNVSRRNEQVSVELCAEFIALRISIALGNKKRVREISRRLDALQTAVQEHLYRKTIEASRAWIDLQLGDKGKLLVSWLQKGDFQKSGLLYSAWGCLYIVYGRYLLLQKDYLPLLGQLREFEAAARSFNNFLLSIYAAVYSAAAQDGLQYENEALSELNRALLLAAADGIVMPFVENFDVLEPLLKKAAQQNSGELELLAKILELGAVYQENLKNIKHKASYIMGGKTLTAREAEIVNFVVQGRTNAEIAAEMFIAEITVKKALQGIYRKLGVDTRLELVMALNADM
ncbi:LuxR C-terminal-related transcriptional regulator [uncultured Phascolarctobacterium sp.]|uniref:helix-turn-helix transcriptional regulator n=1 Tax=uncultured Phascolarctobacterium sp. TaxID=512296 RepID=UPI002588F28C|nr:LuxR C-terminal-related transcriptional regulator [uncultured Phascolarctobacterium sp.]